MLVTWATSGSAPICGSQTNASPFSGSVWGKAAGARRSRASATRESSMAPAFGLDLARFFIPKPLFSHGCKRDRHGYSPPAFPRPESSFAHEHVRSDVSDFDADRTHAGDLLLSSLAPATAARQAVASAGGQLAPRRHGGDGGDH